MYIKFYVDADNPNRWGDGTDDCSEEPDIRATTHWVSSRHKHEITDLKENFYDTFRKHCKQPTNPKVDCKLIQLPDDVAFQFMMDGLQDYDYLVYNPFTENLVFSSNLNSACNKAYQEDMFDTSVSGRAYASSKYTPTPAIMDWNVFDEDNEKYLDTRKVLIPVPDNFYSIVYPEVKTSIQYWYNICMLHISGEFPDIVNDVVREQNNRFGESSVRRAINTGDYPVASYGEEEDCGVGDWSPKDKPIKTIPINADAVYFVLQQYLNDGEWYLGSKTDISLSMYETLRVMYLYLHRESTESPSQK